MCLNFPPLIIHRSLEKCWKCKLLFHVQLFASPWTVTRQDPLSMEFFQARILQWVAISFSRGSSWTRDGTQVSCIAGRFFTIWAHPNSAQAHLNEITPSRTLFPKKFNLQVLGRHEHRWGDSIQSKHKAMTILEVPNLQQVLQMAVMGSYKSFWDFMIHNKESFWLFVSFYRWRKLRSQSLTVNQ